MSLRNICAGLHGDITQKSATRTIIDVKITKLNYLCGSEDLKPAIVKILLGCDSV
jgi:hypothetical protein